MDAAGFGDGRYHLGPLEVEVKEGVARLVEGGSIAGSTLTLDTRVPAGGDRRRAAGRGHRPGDLRQPGPAAGHGRHESARWKPGKDADLVVLDAEFALKGVMRKGEWVVESPTRTDPAMLRAVGRPGTGPTAFFLA